MKSKSSNDQQERTERRIDRREFFGIGIGTVAAVAAIPAAAWLTACGNSDSPPTASSGAASNTGETPPMPKPASAPPAPAAEPAPAPAATPGVDPEMQLVTEIPAAASIAAAIQYVNESEKPDQKCSGCQLYTAGSGGRGTCQLFTEGLVAENGWCASWVPKVS